MLLTVWAGVLSAHATNDLTGSDVSIPQGKVGTISIELNNDDYEFTAFTFKLTLPEGLSFVLNGSGKPTFEKGTRFDESHTLSSSVSGQTATFGCLSGEKAPIAGKSGMLLNVYVQSDAELAVGAELSATLSEVTFTTMDVTEVVFSDATVNISIAEPRLVFDENSNHAAFLHRRRERQREDVAYHQGWRVEHDRAAFHTDKDQGGSSIWC